MNKQKVLVMCLADPSGNPRPNRIISLCQKEGCSVDVMSYPVKGDLQYSEFFEIKQDANQVVNEIKRILARHISWFLPELGNIKDAINDYATGVSHVQESLLKTDYSMIIVEDLKLLPIAFRVRKNAKLIFDAREYYPLQKENSLYFNLFEKRERERLCRKYLSKCDAVITVSNGLKEKYLEEYKIDCQLIRSTPFFHDCGVRESNNNQKIRLVYHGGSNANRNLSNMIAIVEKLPVRFSLDLFLVGGKSAIDNVRNSISSKDRIRIKPPIPFNSIVEHLNEYDIGFYYLEPTGFNVKYALPNKLFEYIQARLMIVIGPSPDMKKVVEEYRCGVVAGEFSIESMVATLKDLTHEEINKYKHNSDKAAKELCYEVESKKFLELFKKLDVSESI